MHRHGNTTYWIDDGTLLGQARNSSFIPWDLDVVCFTNRVLFTRHPAHYPVQDVGFLNEEYLDIANLFTQVSGEDAVFPRNSRAQSLSAGKAKTMGRRIS